MVDVHHVISMFGVGISPTSLFILDRIYILLYTVLLVLCLAAALYVYSNKVFI
jgi:hypothetical protein